MLEGALLRTAGAEAALAALLEAYESASRAGDCRWQFAVEVPILLAQGESINLLRLLLRARLAENRQETTKPPDSKRKFLPLMNLSLPDRSCLALTDAGLALAREFFHKPRVHLEDPFPAPSAEGLPRPRRTPEWDALRRELRYGDQFVKVYRVPAANQERILEAFQVAGWPECLDDPLSYASEQDAKAGCTRRSRSSTNPRAMARSVFAVTARERGFVGIAHERSKSLKTEAPTKAPCMPHEVTRHPT